jgi:ATP-dependent exoDNAse (exonuclease V) beta subunit
VQRQVGIVVHQALQHLSQLAELPTAVPAVTADACDAALRQAGLTGNDLSRARQQVVTALRRTLASSDGRWLLSSREHYQSRSEWPVTRIDADGVCQQLVIDRSFVTRDTGERWLVDYKTDHPPPGEDRAVFIRGAIARHAEQLQRYRDAVAAMADDPLRCALYLTELGLLVELEDLRVTPGSESVSRR